MRQYKTCENFQGKHVLYCPIKAIVVFNHLYIWILF